ncbi:GFA family protein [Shewanella alkalitolerans]|uniref:GFA family protein n=1 Tax=Shewanella alkalitolerans TaxID=2864209 RepID=UPI001C6587D2|nr:GFA family protein [Shewanella alkalitolerans]QYJ98782.1 GFA family protein [Shewanella alkalitolerans]
MDDASPNQNSSDVEFSGSCLCGGVAFSLVGRFDAFYLCHCNRCQKGTGSLHGANLFSNHLALVWRRGEALLQTFQVANTRHKRCFCKVCGSPMPYRLAALNLVVVPAGCLDVEVSIAPTAKLFMAERANWGEELSSVPGFDRLPE